MLAITLLIANVRFVSGGNICNSSGYIDLGWYKGRCFCPNSPYHVYGQETWDSTLPYWERHKASDIPKRKSPVRSPGQPRIAVYNHRSNDWFKLAWQGELGVNPRRVLWARRRRNR